MKENPSEFILMAFQNRDNGVNSAAEKNIEMLNKY